jgi:hypothetical protein
MNPYIQQMMQQQNLGGVDPMFQNIAAQQANQNMGMQQGQGLTQAAGQTGQGGGMSPMALAMMLRQGKTPNTPAPVTDYSQPMPNYTDPAYQQAGY